MAAASASIFTFPRQSYGTTRSVASTNANQCVSKALAEGILPNKADTSDAACTKWKILSINRNTSGEFVGSIPTGCTPMEPSNKSIGIGSVSIESHHSYITNWSASTFLGASVPRRFTKTNRTVNINRKVTAAAVVATTPSQEIDVINLPTWATFERGISPVYWKTMNGLPPTSGEKLKIFYNPSANKLAPNEEFGIAFNGGFNQPIMCGGEPRAMLMQARGKADDPFYTIQICVPKHAVNLIFSFTNGVDWDGPYRLKFQVPKPWRNRPIDFFNEGLAAELSKEGACERAIFPDTTRVVTRCAMIGNLSLEGGDRCNLDLVPGCMDPSSPLYDPLANVDDGSCSVDLEDED